MTCVERVFDRLSSEYLAGIIFAVVNRNPPDKKRFRLIFIKPESNQDPTVSTPLNHRQEPMY